MEKNGLTAIYVYGDELVESIAKFGDDAVEVLLSMAMMQ